MSFPSKKRLSKRLISVEGLSIKYIRKICFPRKSFKRSSFYVSKRYEKLSLYGRASKGLLSVENISRIFYIYRRPPKDFLSKKDLSKKTTQRCSIYKWHHKDLPYVEKLPRLPAMNDPLSIHRRHPKGLLSLDEPPKPLCL